MSNQQPAAEGGCASITSRATRASSPSERTPRKFGPNAALQAATSPPNREETLFFAIVGDDGKHGDAGNDRSVGTDE